MTPLALRLRLLAAPLLLLALAVSPSALVTAQDAPAAPDADDPTAAANAAWAEIEALLEDMAAAADDHAGHAAITEKLTIACAAFIIDHASAATELQAEDAVYVLLELDALIRGDREGAIARAVAIADNDAAHEAARAVAFTMAIAYHEEDGDVDAMAAVIEQFAEVEEPPLLVGAVGLARGRHAIATDDRDAARAALDALMAQDGERLVLNTYELIDAMAAKWPFLKEGELAPNFILPSIKDESIVQLTDLRGKWVLIDFWATW